MVGLQAGHTKEERGAVSRRYGTAGRRRGTAGSGWLGCRQAERSIGSSEGVLPSQAAALASLCCSSLSRMWDVHGRRAASSWLPSIPQVGWCWVVHAHARTTQSAGCRSVCRRPCPLTTPRRFRYLRRRNPCQAPPAAQAGGAAQAAGRHEAQRRGSSGGEQFLRTDLCPAASGRMYMWMLLPGVACAAQIYTTHIPVKGAVRADVNVALAGTAVVLFTAHGVQ